MKSLQELLYKSYDEDLSDSEKLKLEQGLIEHEELMEEKLSLDKMRKRLAGFEANFDPGFADDVMNAIQNANKNQIDSLQLTFNIFKRVALSGVAAVIILLFTIYFTDGSLSLDAIFGLSDYAPAEVELAFFDFQ